MKHLILAILVLRAGAAVAASHQEVLDCVRYLETLPSLGNEQLQTVIGGSFGDGPLPAELKRSYNRRGRPLITLTYRLGVRHGGQLSIGIGEMPPEHFKDLIHLVQRDLSDRLISARLSPVSNGEDALRSDPIKAYAASTGFRHPLTPDEAARLFLVLDSILIQRVPSQDRDSIKFGVLTEPGRTF